MWRFKNYSVTYKSYSVSFINYTVTYKKMHCKFEWENRVRDKKKGVPIHLSKDFYDPNKLLSFCFFCETAGVTAGWKSLEKPYNKMPARTKMYSRCWFDGVFWGPRGWYIFFLNNIFNLKGSCVLRTLKNSFAIFWAWRTYIHTYIHTHTHTYIHTHKVRAD